MKINFINKKQFNGNKLYELLFVEYFRIMSDKYLVAREKVVNYIK
jgi:hypothetical protein